MRCGYGSAASDGRGGDICRFARIVIRLAKCSGSRAGCSEYRVITGFADTITRVLYSIDPARDSRRRCLWRALILQPDTVIAMPVTRRQLIKCGLIAGLFGWLPFVRAARQQPAVAMEATLQAWLDILIPADEAPSASQLGVDRALLEKAESDAEYREVLVRGVAWLDRQARGRGGSDFLSLDEADSLAITSRAASAGTDTLEGIFFTITRADATLEYYARPEGWSGLPGYHGPPQPLGYMDHHRPPIAKTAD